VVSSTQLSTASATRLVTVWLLLFHWPRHSIFTNSTGMSRLTTSILCKSTLRVRFGSHPISLSTTHKTPQATSPGWTMSASNTCHNLTKLMRFIPKLVYTVVQLILTCHLKTSGALMTKLNGLMKKTLMLNGVQPGIQLTSSSLKMEPMPPTPQLLDVQFMLPAVKVLD